MKLGHCSSPFHEEPALFRPSTRLPSLTHRSDGSWYCRCPAFQPYRRNIRPGLLQHHQNRSGPPPPFSASPAEPRSPARGSSGVFLQRASAAGGFGAARLCVSWSFLSKPKQKPPARAAGLNTTFFISALKYIGVPRDAASGRGSRGMLKRFYLPGRERGQEKKDEQVRPRKMMKGSAYGKGNANYSRLLFRWERIRLVIGSTGMAPRCWKRERQRYGCASVTSKLTMRGVHSAFHSQDFAAARLLRLRGCLRYVQERQLYIHYLL